MHILFLLRPEYLIDTDIDDACKKTYGLLQTGVDMTACPEID